jgi:parvulin-like peptidyl-prolyl isomerase
MKTKTFLAAILLLTASAGLLGGDVVEEIYAVVNDEAITGSELKKFEADMIRSMGMELEGEALEKAAAEFRENLLDRFIEQKLLLSKVKEKNYDVDADVETIIQEIKKQNNIPSDEELKAALTREGIEFATWKDMLREQRRQQRLVAEEVGSKIKIDNPQIMEYYRKNAAQFTVPAEFALNCIYLGRSDDGARPQEKMDQVLAALKPGNFADVARKHSELPGVGESIALGRFKQGELDPKLEEAALQLKQDEYSEWIETENGWYIIQLAEFSPEKLREVREVREDIVMMLREAEQQVKLKEYIGQLKKESYIRIVKNYE